MSDAPTRPVGPPPAGVATAPPEDALAAVVERLAEANLRPASLLCRSPRAQEHPSPAVVADIVENLRGALFPGYFGVSEVHGGSLQFHIGATLDRTIRRLREQIRRGLCFTSGADSPAGRRQAEEQAASIVGTFLQRLPEVRRMLGTDVEAAFTGDPAATSPDETLFCYPGVLAITCLRLAHELYELGAPMIPRMITEHAHSVTGIDIHPGARIGESMFIDHGTGVVIGETCIIGNRVRLYQGVTLGAKSFRLDDRGQPIKGVERHPIVEDDVIIYSGATILGRVVIGRGSVIGGNVWLTRSVPPGSRVTQARAREELYENGAGI